MLFGKTSAHSSSDGKPGSGNGLSSARLSKTLLIGLSSCYGICQFILFIMSAVAWSFAKKPGERGECILGHPDYNGPAEGCGHSRWAIYPFITFGSLICFFTTAFMAFRATFHTQGSPLDAMYIFRGAFFTVLIMATLVLAGWTSPFPVIHHPVLPDGTVAQIHLSSYLGMCGTFIFEVLDNTFQTSKPAMAMCHFNL